MNHIRILFFADSHLGFDNALNARIERRRRWIDFQDNFEFLVNRAMAGDIDLVVHGGDIFYRSRVSPQFVHQCFDQLKRVTRHGIPVYVVPGNHERSKIPFPVFAVDPEIHIFDRPRHYMFCKNNMTIMLAGFPYRKLIRNSFEAIFFESLKDSGIHDFSLLCIHQTVEGSTVGPNNYRFYRGEDVLPRASLPDDIDAILSGHIHRHQILINRTAHHPPQKKAPIIYPGSIERTSFAERHENKGYCLIDLIMDPYGIKHVKWSFHSLKTRNMIVHALTSWPSEPTERKLLLESILRDDPPDSIVCLYFKQTNKSVDVPSIKDVRSILPQTMNVTLKITDAI